MCMQYYTLNPSQQVLVKCLASWKTIWNPYLEGAHHPFDWESSHSNKYQINKQQDVEYLDKATTIYVH